MKIIQNFIACALPILALGACEAPIENDAPSALILPHHNLVGEFIDEVYSDVASDQIERVIIVSTNHFDTGYSNIQSSKSFKTTLDYDDELIDHLGNEKVLRVEERNFNLEHGITVHTEYIEKYMPDAQIVPIIIKWGVPEPELDSLISAVKSSNLENTLYVGSIDFTHYVSEEIASENDARTMQWLEDWGDGKVEDISLQTFWDLERSIGYEPDLQAESDLVEVPTAMDSPETMYVITQLVGEPEEVEIWKRTSSASMYNIENPLENTSHLFVKIW